MTLLQKVVKALRIQNLPVLTPNELFEYYFTGMVMGPKGSGKTTLLKFLEWHWLETKKDSLVISLMPKTIAEKYRAFIPEEYADRMSVHHDPNSFELWFDNVNNQNEQELEAWFDKPKFINADEFSRLLNKYQHNSAIAQRFVQLLMSSRHKKTTIMFSDQEYDFLEKIRLTSPLWFFTGATGALGAKIKSKSVWSIGRWYDYNTEKLIMLGRANRQLLKNKGFGIAIVTNGHAVWTLFFKRSPFHKQNLSYILKYLRPDEVRVEETKDSRPFDFDSPEWHAKMFAYHLIVKNGHRPTPERLDSFYKIVTPVFFSGKNRALNNNGRDDFKDVKYSYETKYDPFVLDPDYFIDCLEQLVTINRFEKPEVSPEKRDKITQLLDELGL